ncbi:hypothetical protein SAMN04488005_0600 [Yoonia tamlensis]|uniref:Uncharacterized protein n=1 Tax=Yoonia tamlensis TaxID=390270 RepID=A0A1I6FW04_9RHOB|nr:hypothetical protein [Yoonia tamlensis]SFR34104.1 hypothetical protein SAMN04488005_0600 [Yoonia tamlensis]
MKKLVLGCVMFLGACETGGVMGGSPGMQERLVIGNRSMTFEQCRASGGLIIRDQGSPMVACDPSVRGEPVPADEFNHPTT